MDWLDKMDGLMVEQWSYDDRSNGNMLEIRGWTLSCLKLHGIRNIGGEIWKFEVEKCCHGFGFSKD